MVQLIFGIDSSTVKKGIVLLAIERSILERNGEKYETVAKQLGTKFGCGVADCYEHPEYLKEILKEMYGDSFVAVADSIVAKLEEFKEDSKISRFIDVIYCKT